jgi:hypothetical protein
MVKQGLRPALLGTVVGSVDIELPVRRQAHGPYCVLGRYRLSPGHHLDSKLYPCPKGNKGRSHGGATL